MRTLAREQRLVRKVAMAPPIAVVKGLTMIVVTSIFTDLVEIDGPTMLVECIDNSTDDNRRTQRDWQLRRSAGKCQDSSCLCLFMN